jgi:hypothetical protein
VDPEFIAPPGYTTVLSEGVRNPVMGVPEPSIFTLLLAGFTGLGAVRYAAGRCRRSASVA